MTILPAYNSIISSARILPPDKKITPKYERWQDELWDYYDRLGEFESGVSWLASTMSRVRLVAAELIPGGDEPVTLTEGVAASAVMRLAGGAGGQAQLMREMALHLSVPGEGWLVGESRPDEDESWRVYSADEIQLAKKGAGYEVREDEKTWRRLDPKSLVVRFWEAHPRFGWRADSAAKHAMSAMLELDLVKTRIVAEIISRLASNGILLYDKQRLSFPNSPSETGDNSGVEQVDPFAEILVDVASRPIKDPTSPEAAIPIPIGFDLQDATDVDPKMLLQWLQLSNPLDEKLLGQRDSAVKRLATSLDMPAEVMLGMGGMNHWGAWQIEESGIKIHIAPKAELISHSLTVGYLTPYLKAVGEPLIGPNGGRIVVWYDPSEITTRPDKSGNVIAAYDRLEASGDALRREIGLSEEDAPTQEELVSMFLKKQAPFATTAFSALYELSNGEIDLRPPELQGTGHISDVRDRSESEVPEVEDLPDPPPVRAPTEDESPNVALSLSDISDEELIEEAKRRFAEQSTGTYWAEASVPIEMRTTPERRNGRVEVDS